MKTFFFLLAAVMLCTPYSVAQHFDNQGLLLQAVYDTLPDTLKAIDKYESVTDVTYVMKDKESLIVVPTQWRIVEEPLLVKEGYTGNQQPIYKTITKRVLVKEQATVIKIVPEKDTVVQEQVMVHPGEMVVVKRKEYTGQITPACFDEHNLDTCRWQQAKSPAKYKTVMISRVLKPAHPITLTDAAKYQLVEQQVIDKEKTAKQAIQKEVITIAPLYSSIQVKKVVQPATTKKDTKTICEPYYVKTKRLVSSSFPTFCFRKQPKQ